MMDKNIETVTPNKLYVMHIDEDGFDSDDIVSNYAAVKSKLPEGSELLFIRKGLDLKEMPLDEAIGLRDFLDDYINNLPKNLE